MVAVSLSRSRGSGQAKPEGKDQRDDAFHSLMSPPGSVFFNSSWTARVCSATCLVASASVSMENDRMSPALTPLGRSFLGKLIWSPSSVTRTAI